MSVTNGSHYATASSSTPNSHSGTTPTMNLKQTNKSPYPGGMPAPFPQNEDERVQALLDYRIMDTQAENAFDQLAVLASQICQTPIALVSLVDHERQWFKARIGLEPEETHRDLAFCAHAILQEEVFEIPDATNDYRFADSPLVTGAPNIRFYAGMPLINNDGLALGTLCAIDTKPKQLTQDQRMALKILSQQTIAQLELRRHVARLTETMVQVHDTKKALEESIRIAELARDDAERARMESEKANAAKSEFLANMSHEIRTPMNGVLGMATLLSQTVLSKEQTEYVSTIQASGEHLLTVLNDILDYSKQESGKLELENTELDVYQTVEQAIELSFRKDDIELVVSIQGQDEIINTAGASSISSKVPTSASATLNGASAGLGSWKGHGRAESQDALLLPIDSSAAFDLSSLTLSADHPASMPHLILGDVTRLRQIIVNIISNSCKFTKPGGTITVNLGLSNAHTIPGESMSYETLEYLVKMGIVSKEYWIRLHSTYALKEDELHSTRFLELEFSIRDTGIGIPKSKMSKLFKAFSQVDASTTREYGGTGLGLAISAKLVSLMGGRMWCDSVEGEGATFSFTLITPIVKATASSISKALLPSPSPSPPPSINSTIITPPITSSPDDISCPIVNRHLTLLPQSPRTVVLVSSHAAFSRNIKTQLIRWGLTVHVYTNSSLACEFIRSLSELQMADVAAVIVDYVATQVPASPAIGIRRLSTDKNGASSLVRMPSGDGDRKNSLTAAASAATASTAATVPPLSLRTIDAGSTQLSTDPSSSSVLSKHELAHTIRLFETRSNCSISTPIFYLTSGTLLPEEITITDDLGISILRKPFLFTKFRILLQNLLTFKTKSPKCSPRLPMTRKLAETCPVSILVVEDNKVNMKLALKMLSNMGYMPQGAFNGAEAASLVTEKNQHFDIIFMDMVMPVKDGLIASKEILSHYTTNCKKHAPPIIIAMTASAMEQDRQACNQAGMIDFVAKPVNLSSLRSKLIEWATKCHPVEHAAASAAALSSNNSSLSLPITGAGVPIGGNAPRIQQLLHPKTLTTST